MSTSPTPREALAALAHNHRWSWDTPTADLLGSLPGAEPGIHPTVTVSALDEASLAGWAASHGDALAACLADLDTVCARVGSPEIAYFSPEFGVAAEVAQYSGGLGILAGDHLKAASDLALPLVGIGLRYREGFFRQSIVAGAQTERYEPMAAEAIGAVSTGLSVRVPVAGELVSCRIWRQDVGSTVLLLLDTDVVGNSASARSITDRLYSGDRRHRLSQELVLGVGGVRALRALGMAPGVFHLNEGHACFLLLELLAEHVEAGMSLDAARAEVAASTLFTTHTPVPAGIDRFERSLVTPELEPWAQRLGTDVATISSWAGFPDDGRTKPFNTAAFALRLCGRVNGVSQLHAVVSRDLFSSLPESAGIEGITNGVHARTWVTPPLQDLYDEVLGAGWSMGDPDAWSKAGDLADEPLAAIRDAARRDLVALVARTTGTELDPDACTIGFARRFATYKRAALLLRDPEALAGALEAGAQFVFAGKAHPADAEGKAVLARLAAFAGSTASKGRIVLVPDYDIAVARTMYAGSDVWLNNPVRPHEACGTSGEKAALNGVLNCSILDGWWADWFTEGIGWAIPTVDPDPDTVGEVADDARDDAEAAAMLAIITGEVLPRFAGTAEGSWWDMVRTMLAHLGPLVTAARMVDEYDRRYYTPIRSR